MNETRLRADYNGPRTHRKDDCVRFYWESKSKLYPRTRYRLTFNPNGRFFQLTKYIRFKLTGKEMKRSVTAPEVIAVFRSCLDPDQISLVTRLSMPR